MSPGFALLGQSPVSSYIADGDQLLTVLVRLGLAVVLGGLLGYQREQTGKAAGLRTHILVTLAAALFVLIGDVGGMPVADQSRVIQGVATGIGFIGAGTIIKLSERRQIKGLTTAAGLWLATAIGIAVGLGRILLAVTGTVVAFAVLAGFIHFERHSGRLTNNPPGSSPAAKNSKPHRESKSSHTSAKS